MLQCVRLQHIDGGGKSGHLLTGKYLPDDEKALPIELIRFVMIHRGMLLTTFAFPIAIGQFGIRQPIS